MSRNPAREVIMVMVLSEYYKIEKACFIVLRVKNLYHKANEEA